MKEKEPDRNTGKFRKRTVAEKRSPNPHNPGDRHSVLPSESDDPSDHDSDTFDIRQATTVAGPMTPEDKDEPGMGPFVPGGDLDTIDILESELEHAFRTGDVTFDHRQNDADSPKGEFTDGEKHTPRGFDRNTVIAPNGDLEALDHPLRTGDADAPSENTANENDDDPDLMDLDSETVFALDQEMANLRDDATIAAPITETDLNVPENSVLETAELPMDTVEVTEAPSEGANNDDDEAEILQLTPDMVIEEQAPSPKKIPTKGSIPDPEISSEPTEVAPDDDSRETFTDFDSQTILLSDVEDEDTETYSASESQPSSDAEESILPLNSNARITEEEMSNQEGATVFLSDLEDEIEKASGELEDRQNNAPPTDEPVLELGADALVATDDAPGESDEPVDRDGATVFLSDLEDEIEKASGELEDRQNNAPPTDEPVLELGADALVATDDAPGESDEPVDRDGATVFLSDLEDEIEKASGELEDRQNNAPPTDEPVLELGADALVATDDAPGESDEPVDRDGATVFLSDLEDEIEKASGELESKQDNAHATDDPVVPAAEDSLTESETEISRDAPTIALSSYDDVVYADEAASRSADTETDTGPDGVTELTPDALVSDEEDEAGRDSATVLMPLSENDAVEAPSFLKRTPELDDASSDTESESHVDLDAETVLDTETPESIAPTESEDDTEEDIESSLDALTIFAAKTDIPAESTPSEPEKPAASEPVPETDIDAFAAEGLKTIDLLDGLGDSDVTDRYMEDSIGFLDVIDGDMDLYPDESDEIESLLEINRIDPSVTEELETLQAPQESAAPDEPDAATQPDSENADTSATAPSSEPPESSTSDTDENNAKPAELPATYRREHFQESRAISPEEIEHALERVIDRVFSERIEKIMKSVIEKAVADEVARFRNFLMADISEAGQWIDDELIS